jgi:mannan endo-1,4-beta-mannosidase
LKQLYKFCAAALMIGAAGMVQAAPAANNDFVTVKNTHFARNGKAYYIVGANFWYGGYLGAPSGVGERERLLKELDNMKALGINNLRVLAVSRRPR